MTDLHLSQTCVDCKAAEASIDARRRPLCGECFVKYITSKAIKRIDSYRFKIHPSKKPEKLLLPVSCGVSSSVLLQILDRQLHRQRSSRGQTAYELHICVVESPLLGSHQDLTERFTQLKARYPAHPFSLVSLPEVLQLDDTVHDMFRELGLTESNTRQTDLDNFVACQMTASSRADILQFLLTRLIVTIAKSKACSAVLWGHCDSRLATKALSNVAKGRGVYLPFELGDGPTPWGVVFFYPLRDLLKSELVTYAKALQDSFYHLVIPDKLEAEAITTTRTTSIDDLISNYINTQGERYPSIMANVVRTAGKLHALDATTDPTPFVCSICALPSDETTGREMTGESHMCYSCSRLALEMTAQKP